MFETIKKCINDAQSIVVIQAENPDGDSIGSALALEEILGDQGKEISLYCPVDIPKYLRYIKGWDRITSEFNASADMAIIVDTSADILLEKVLQTPHVRHYLETHEVVVFDHHATESTLSFSHHLYNKPVIATGELLLDVAKQANWNINPQAAEHMLIAMMSDSLGLTTPNVTGDSFRSAGELTDLGASISDIEERRREFMKKSPEILAYKGELISHVEYYLDGRLALVHIPWEEIEKYSDQYNPGALILDELRLVENVDVAIAVKTYPDSRLTGRIRCTKPVGDTIAGYFGGGGHPYAAGFRIYENYDATVKEIITATQKALDEYDSTV